MSKERKKDATPQMPIFFGFAEAGPSTSVVALPLS